MLALLVILGIAIAVIIAPLTGAEANPIYVRHGSSGDGSSWANACGNLQVALDQATSGDEIWVACGTYNPVHPGSPGTRTDSFRMKKGVKIYGGFNGTEVSLNQRNCYDNKTILSGDIGDQGTTTDNCYHVFYHPAGTSLDNTAVLDGFTITGGNANGVGSHAYGGGIYNSSGSPAIINCIFQDNHAFADGGGMYNEKSSPAITNCIFYRNDAQYGGAIFNGNQSSPVLTNCTIYGNSAYCGGGIANFNYSLPVITNCILWGDNSSSSGHEIYNSVASPYITYSDVWGGWIGPGNISGTPSFVDPGNADFHLQPDSVCINAGINSAINLNAIDFEGDDRIINGTVDMGVDEFEEDIAQYNLTISSTIGGSVDTPGEGTFGPYGAGTMVDLIADPDANWHFVNWTGETSTIANVNDSTTTITMNGDYTIAANFEEDIAQYNLTISSTIGGSVDTPGEGTFGPYGAGTMVDLVADPDANWHFVNWTGETSTIANVNDSTTTITMNWDYSITANFAIDEWSCLVYDSNHNDKIEYAEMVDALMDYLTSTISYAKMIDVLMCYLIS